MKLKNLEQIQHRSAFRSIHPQGWVPIETSVPRAFTGLPVVGSIHPQGWVPIETYCAHRTTTDARDLVAFTPKGGCPLKLSNPSCKIQHKPVAFTPKGGCPLKLCKFYDEIAHFISSIHPQGWVPIETCTEKEKSQAMCNTVAFTPKGGCPLKLNPIAALQDACYL